MEYKGKLYGKISDKYFFTGRTSDEWDEMVAKINEIESQLIKYQESIKDKCMSCESDIEKNEGLLFCVECGI